MNQEVTTGVSEARSHQRRGKKTPTLMTLNKNNRRKTTEHESKECWNGRSAEAVKTNVVKRSVPRLTAWSPRLHEASPLRKWRE
jgi:ribosomal protein L34E